MSPQFWIPQNIQKRLLLYVLQKLLLFSQIDLPNLEEVSLNNFIIKDVLIDPDKVGKLPGFNLRYGQLKTLELLNQGGVMGGGVVLIHLNDLELVLSPTLDVNEDIKNHIQQQLVQSTADLANTVILDEDSFEDYLTHSQELALSTSSSEDGDSHSSSEASASKPSALSGVMSKAADIAILRLQIKISNLRIKFISDLHDLLIEVDSGLIQTISGTRHVQLNNIRIYSLNSDTPKGASDTNPEQGTTETSDEEDEEDEDPDDYGDESLMDSMIYTHEEASSIYMSATSNAFGSSQNPRKLLSSPSSSNESSKKGSAQSSRILERLKNTLIVHIDQLETSFVGLQSIVDLVVDIHTIKIAFVPLAPTIISLLSKLTRVFKVKLHQKRKAQQLLRFLNRSALRFQNTRFPEYDRNDDVYEEESTTPKSEEPESEEDDLVQKQTFQKFRIANILISTNSALLPLSDFAKSVDNYLICITNIFIKQKNSVLLNGGIECLQILKTTENESVEIFKYLPQTLTSSAASSVASPAPLTTNEANSTSDNVAVNNTDQPTSSQHLSRSSRADIRFEFCNNVAEKKSEISVLLSKVAEFKLSEDSLAQLLNVVIAFQTISSNLSSMVAAYDAIQSFMDSQEMSSKPRSRVGGLKSKPPPTAKTTSEFSLRTSSWALSLALGSDTTIGAAIAPINFNSSERRLGIQKLNISITRDAIESKFITIHDILLNLRSKELKSWVKRIGTTPHSVSSKQLLTISQSSLLVSKVHGSISLSNLKNLGTQVGLFILLLQTKLINYSDMGLAASKDTNAPFQSGANSSIFRHRVKSKRALVNNTLANSVLMANNKSIAASINFLIKEFKLEVTDIAPGFGELRINVHDIEAFVLSNGEVQGSIKNLSGERRLKQLREYFLNDYQKRELSQMQFPMILFQYHRNTVDITMSDLNMEYYTSWLKFFKDTENNSGPSDPQETFESKKNNKVDTKRKGSMDHRFDIRFTLKDCIVGLNPGRLSSKAYLVVNTGNADLTLSSFEFYIKSSLREVSLLLIDDPSLPQPQLKTSKSHHKFSQEYFTSKGYVSVGHAGLVHLGLTVITDLKAALEHDKAMGVHKDLPKVEFKINSNDHRLNLCADSSFTLIQLINDLKLPLDFTDKDRFKVELDDGPIDVFADLDENWFVGNDLLETTGSITSSKKLDVVEEYEANSSSYSDRKTDSTSLSHESDEVVYEPIKFEENHFAAVMSPPETYPLKIVINLSKINIFLFDGYDWRETRKNIRTVVKKVEARINEERRNQLAALQSDDQVVSPTQSAIRQEGTTDGKKLKKKIKFKDDDTQEDGQRPIIDETLYQSIHLSVTENTDAVNLVNNINNEVQMTNYEFSTDEQSIGTNYKNLKLRRSHSHKINMELKGLSVDVKVASTRDPRWDYTDPTMAHEILSEITLSIELVIVHDNVPSSTWSKFLSYMTSLGEKEIGKEMLKVKITNVRPDPKIVSSEAIISVSILPLRLYVDQDTLDFLSRFGEFKDPRFELPVDEVLFIQKLEVETVKLKLDYKPKKVDYVGIRSGNSSEFMNFFVLDGSNIKLRKVKLYGISGPQKLNSLLKGIWTPDVQATQLPGILAGLAPVKSLVGIGSGFKDLVEVPIKEYKKDGRIFRSLLKGTKKFAKTTGYELLNLGVKLASGTQVILELGEELFGGEGSSARVNKGLNTETEKTITKPKGGPPEAGSLLLASSKRMAHRSGSQMDYHEPRKTIYSHIDVDEPGEFDDDMLSKSLLLLDVRNVKQHRQRRFSQEEFEQVDGPLVESDDDEDEDEDYDSEDEYLDAEEGEEQDALLIVDLQASSNNTHKKTSSSTLSSAANNDAKRVSLYSNPPENIEQGLKSAYKSISSNLGTTKKTLVNLKHEINRSHNFQESLVSVIKSSPIIIIRPLIGTTEALLKTLMGLSNEIDTKNLKESKNKYLQSSDTEG